MSFDGGLIFILKTNQNNKKTRRITTLTRASLVVQTKWTKLKKQGHKKDPVYKCEIWVVNPNDEPACYILFQACPSPTPGVCRAFVILSVPVVGICQKPLPGVWDICQFFQIDVYEINHIRTAEMKLNKK